MFKRIIYVLVLIVAVNCSNSSQEVEQIISKEKEIKTSLDYINYSWWLSLNDKNLERYILRGILNNNDLKISKLKIDEYSKYVKYTFGLELPTLSTSLNYSDIKKLPMGNINIKSDSLTLPLTVSYELDLFGKNRRKTKSTKLQLESYKYQLHSSYISFVSGLSTLYFNIMKYNGILDYYEQLIQIENQILDNITLKNLNGLLTETEINETKQNIKKLNNEKMDLSKIRDSLLTQFAVMLGEDPNSIKSLKISKLDELDTLESKMLMPVSSDIIFKRPDVMAYEREMEKAKVDIEVARREFLPTLSIDGSLVFNNMASGGFFSSANTIRALMIGASQTLFVGGRKKANLAMMNLKYEQMFENYKKVTLQAIKEINDSLMNIFYDLIINNNNEQNLLMELDNYKNDKIKYKNGLISRIDLLTKKRKLIQLKIDFVNSRIQNYIDCVSLYKSVAGQIN